MLCYVYFNAINNLIRVQTIPYFPNRWAQRQIKTQISPRGNRMMKMGRLAQARQCWAQTRTKAPAAPKPSPNTQRKTLTSSDNILTLIIINQPGDY